MKASHLLLAGSLFATTAFADLTITQQVQQEPAAGGQGVDMTMTMKVKGTKLRVDVNPQMSTVTDTASGETMTIMNDQKAYMEIPAELMKKMKEQAMNMSNADNQENAVAPEPKPTGNKKAINGFNCEEYVIESADGAKTTLWITKDIPNADQLLKELDSLSADMNPLKKAAKPADLPGFPVQTIIENTNLGGKTTVTVAGLSQDPVADTEFQAPAGYKKMDMPAMPGQ